MHGPICIEIDDGFGGDRSFYVCIIARGKQKMWIESLSKEKLFLVLILSSMIDQCGGEITSPAFLARVKKGR